MGGALELRNSRYELTKRVRETDETDETGRVTNLETENPSVGGKGKSVVLHVKDQARTRLETCEHPIPPL